MACDFLNKTLNNTNLTKNWSECYRGLDEYSSDKDLSDVLLFLDYPQALLKFSAACCIIFMIIGIPGNIVTIIALSNYKKIRNATAIFIINLSVSDLLFAVIILPVAVKLFLTESWTSGKLMCRLFPLANYTLTAVSVFSIVAITINRYVMVSHPLHYPKLYQTRNLIIMIIAIWVGAFSMLVPILFEVWGRFSLDPVVGFCTVIQDVNGESSKTTIVVMGFAFPSFFVVVCYSRIMYIVRKSASKSSARRPAVSDVKSDSTSRNQDSAKESSSSGSTQEDNNFNDVETNTSEGMLAIFKNNFDATFRRRQRRMSLVPTRRDKRLQTMILAIIISFFACHLPILIAKTASQKFALGPYGNIMGYMMLYVTVCSNPLIYVVMSKEYRQAYNKVFGFLWKDKISWPKIWSR